MRGKTNKTAKNTVLVLPLSAKAKSQGSDSMPIKQWGRSFKTFVPEVIKPCAFDLFVSEHKLQPNQWIGSIRLRRWVRENMNQHYVPEELLASYGFDVSIWNI